MIKILLPLTLLSSALGLQAASATAPCPADVKSMAANAATAAPAVMVVPDHVRDAIRAGDSEIIFQWISQNPAVHKNAVLYHDGDTQPLVICFLSLPNHTEALTHLLDLCPNVLAITGGYKRNILQKILPRPVEQQLVRKIMRMIFLQGTRLEEINQQVQNEIDEMQGAISSSDSMPFPEVRKILERKALQVAHQSAIVFDETAKMRQELGEAAKCEEALQNILLKDLRKMTRTYITNLPAQQQP